MQVPIVGVQDPVIINLPAQLIEVTELTGSFSRVNLRVGTAGNIIEALFADEIGFPFEPSLFAAALRFAESKPQVWTYFPESSVDSSTAVFPTKIPLYIFLDVGTYAGAWDKNSESGRFLYVGGLQLNLFKDLVKIYAPVFYSSEFRNSLKTVPEENGFWRKVSFSIDVQRLNLRRIFNGQIPF